MDISAEFVFVGRGDEGFLENYSYELEEDPDRRGGTLYMCLEILNNDAEAEEMGETVFQNLKQVFYEDLEKPAYDRFEEAVKKVNAALEEFRSSKVSRFIGNLNVCIAALIGNELYLTQTGDAEAYLIRKRYVSVISEGLGGESKEGETFTNIASGALEENDVILLSSSRLLRYVTKNDLGKFLTVSGKKEGAITESLAELQDHLMTEILGRAALIGILIPRKEIPEPSGAAAQVEEEARASSLPGWIQKFSAHKHIKRLFAEKLSRKLHSGHRGILDFARDRVLVALVIVIILLLAGIILLRVKGVKSDLIADHEVKLTHAQELISDAATQGQFDREKGALLLKNAENEALEVLNSRYLRNKASRLLDEIARQRSLLDNVQLVVQPRTVADLTEKRSSVSGLGLMFLKDRLFAFEGKHLFEILLDTLMEPKAISETDTAVLGASFPDQEALVFQTRDAKIIEYREGRFFFMDTADRTWKKGVDIETYADRLYVLDPERNQIWRYRRRRDAYDIGEATNLDGDLTKAKAFAIDGSVYVLSSDGGLQILYAGKKQNIPFHDSPFSALKNPTRIFTNTELAQIFILEPSENRVVSYFKDRRQGGQVASQLVYQNQYVFQGTGELRDLYVSKDEGKLYVMDASKIYVTDLTE